MQRYYQNIDIENKYQGIIFSGVQFKDHKGQLVISMKEHFKSELINGIWSDYESRSNKTSNVCGIETNNYSRWNPVGGPIKGSYVNKKDQDSWQDYISDFGLRVEDPCQAVDNTTQNIGLNPTHTSVKDLKYHDGTDSQFWIRTVCQNSKALQLVDVSAFPFLKLRHGNLAVLSTPPDQCTRLEVQHRAPDNSLVTNVFHLHTINNDEAAFEKCSPHHGNCQPNIKDLALTGTAGFSKTVTLFHQASVESYFRACEGALFDLTDAPFWLTLTNSSFLVIDAPNEVNFPGKYKFSIGIWAVTLKVFAPCSSNYLQGLTE